MNKKQIVLFVVVVAIAALVAVVAALVVVVTFPMFCLLHLIVGLCRPRKEGKNFIK